MNKKAVYMKQVYTKLIQFLKGAYPTNP